jgi:hypothetical protein
MRSFSVSLLALLIGVPLYGQGLTITMKETGPTGLATQPMLQADRTRARLEMPSLASQVLYDSETKILRVVVPLAKIYTEYTAASVQEGVAAGRGQPALARITYKRTGSSKAAEWPCSTYDGFRGSEKVVEICAAEGNAIGLTSADFTLVQEAVNMVKTIAPPDIIERIPVYGSAESQGFTGFPVRRVSFRNGQPDTTTELVEIKREPVPAPSFAVPAGFTKTP